MYRVDYKKLEKAMEDKNISKEDVAKAIGVDRSTLYRRLRNGKLLVADAHKICDVLELSDLEAVNIFLSA